MPRSGSKSIWVHCIVLCVHFWPLASVTHSNKLHTSFGTREKKLRKELHSWASVVSWYELFMPSQLSSIACRFGHAVRSPATRVVPSASGPSKQKLNKRNHGRWRWFLLNAIETECRSNCKHHFGNLLMKKKEFHNGLIFKAPFLFPSLSYAGWYKSAFFKSILMIAVEIKCCCDWNLH